MFDIVMKGEGRSRSGGTALMIVSLAFMSVSASMISLDNIESARLTNAKTKIPALQEVLRDIGDEVSKDASDLATTAKRQDVCRDYGRTLWDWAKSKNWHDDRLLYWSRLAIAEHLFDLLVTAGALIEERTDCLAVFDSASRGRSQLSWKPGHFRMLVSGFDPFLLDENIEQSNPSGLSALRLDDQVLKAQNGELIHVRAVIFPVRFQDFDDGVVEALLEPLLRADAIDAFISISMGRDAFDLERFPGRRRSASALDNVNRPSGGSEDQPWVPLLRSESLDGPEFLEFSLPAERMREAPGRWLIRDNRTITSLEQGTLRAAQLSQLLGQTAVRGSGGGYLSNEIAYRALNVMDRSDSKIPMGHIHTPRMSTFDRAFLNDVYDQIKAMLIRLP